MPLIEYVPKEFSAEHMRVIGQANQIIEAYRQAGYDLTIRQLYYQFVARGLIPNEEKSYKRLIGIIGDARLAGLIDWRAIVDRTRSLVAPAHWGGPAEIVEAAAESYAIDKWAGQPERVEVWVEKEALVNVLEQVCEPWDVPYFACRGYTSLSEMWAAGQRLIGYQDEGQRPVVIYLGDHDPSGVDMTRDITDRLVVTFEATDVEVVRLALNMDQIQQFNPPPNPAKVTDSRAKGYIERFGDESWELDAMNPTDIAALIDQEIQAHLDPQLFEEKRAEQEADREKLRNAAAKFQQEQEDEED